MPSQKPRLALTLPPELEAALTALAEAEGRPVSAVTVGLLLQVMPQIEGLTKMLNAAKSGNTAAVKRQLVHMVGDNLAELMTATQPELFKRKGKRK